MSTKTPIRSRRYVPRRNLRDLQPTAALTEAAAVMDVAKKMQIEFENTKSLMKALFKGMSEGFNNHMEKVNSGSYGKLLRCNEADKLFWQKMYVTLDRTESNSVKIERDALLFESALDKKNLNVDMGFNALHTGYLTFGEYSAKPSGVIVSEFIGI